VKEPSEHPRQALDREFPDKGKPAVRRGRKAMGPFGERVARLPKG
jgi:hypothetical protein